MRGVPAAPLSLAATDPLCALAACANRACRTGTGTGGDLPRGRGRAREQERRGRLLRARKVAFGAHAAPPLAREDLADGAAEARAGPEQHDEIGLPLVERDFEREAEAVRRDDLLAEGILAQRRR